MRCWSGLSHSLAPEQCALIRYFLALFCLQKFAGFSFYYLFGFVLQSNSIVQKGKRSYLLIKSETMAQCECFSPQLPRSGATSGDRLQQEIEVILAFHLQHPR